MGGRGVEKRHTVDLVSPGEGRRGSDFSCSVHESRGSISIGNRPWTVVIEQDGENKVSTRRWRGLATEENQSYRPSYDRGKENEWNEPAGILSLPSGGAR